MVAGPARIKWVASTCSGGAFGILPLGYPGLDDPSDQATVPFNKGELVRETAFKQHAYAVMSSQVSCGYQGHVFTNSKVGEMDHLR